MLKVMDVKEAGDIEITYGYKYVPRDEIDAKDIVYLRDNPDDSYEDDVAVWLNCLDRSLEVVGIGTTDGPRLVAAGFLGGNLRLATIHDIAEHPAYKHLGLDFAIASRLVSLANSRNVHRVLVEEANPHLHSHYKRLGFSGVGLFLSRELPNK